MSALPMSMYEEEMTPWNEPALGGLWSQLGVAGAEDLWGSSTPEIDVEDILRGDPGAGTCTRYGGGAAQSPIDVDDILRGDPGEITYSMY